MAQQVAVAAHQIGRRWQYSVLRRRTRLAAETVVGQFEKRLQRRQQRIPRAAQVDDAAFDIDLGLRDLGPLSQSQGHQFRGRLQVLFLRDSDVVQRQNMYFIQGLAHDAVAAQSVLEHGLLLRDVGLRDQQILLGGGDFGGGARGFNRRQRSYLHLALVAFVKLLRGSKCFLLDP